MTETDRPKTYEQRIQATQLANQPILKKNIMASCSGLSSYTFSSSSHPRNS
jgi:hypothetical protein